MGTLGCVNDMLQRDKENRALRKISRERMKNTRNRLMETGSTSRLPDISAEEFDEIKRITAEKEKSDIKRLFRDKLIIMGGGTVILLAAWLIYLLIN